MSKVPLILTLEIAPESFRYFQELRQKHFPKERNFIDAHLTLFHALPNEHAVSELVKLTSERQGCFEMSVTKPVSIGKGVAFKIESPDLATLHASFQKKWRDNLSLQDRQKIWPHITVQNKVPPENARLLLEQLMESFKPFKVPAIGLQLWEYLNGPWRLMETFAFQPAT